MFAWISSSRIVALALGAISITTILGVTLGNERERAPQWLSETGLYGAEGAIDPRNRPFVPQYPLWSDGAEKRRWSRLPEGATIDVSDMDAWRFPAGAKFWKEFSWNGRKVETRMIWKTGSEDWVFATYIWTDDQKDARLAPEGGVANVLEIGRGKRHSIPGIEDCNACHRQAPAIVLGFNALQLSDDRDPMAPHAESLPPAAVTARTLVEENRLQPPRPELVTHPPRIRETDPVARAALGYLSANCGGCHNDRGPLARLGLTLLHDVARDGAPEPRAPEPARATGVNGPSRYVIPGIPEERSRIITPGGPDASSLLYRMRSRRPSSQMPPLGTAIPDDPAIELIRRWIESVKAP